MSYRHTQLSPMMYLIAAIGVVGVGVGVTTRDDLGGGLWWYLSAMVLLIVVGVIASRLTVSIGDDAVTAAFGWGWPRRRIELAEIDHVEHIETSWWYGWGIRKVRHGWMYNNAGRGAVALHLRSGTAFWIGTDERKALADAIEQARQAR